LTLNPFRRITLLMARRKLIHPLKAYRLRHGLTQRGAAQRHRVSQAAWDRWERGVRRPNREMTQRLLDETGVSLAALMGVAL
jgi:transcriptional regulator with XRE-family HTH domain